jgi:nicotinamidase/pyrazinamidase
LEYTKRALLVVDVQNDFCEHGAVPSLLGSQLASLISIFAQTNYNKYELLLASKDSHKSPKGHFSSSPDFLYSWPKHCLESSEGEKFHPNLNSSLFDHVITKGINSAGMSAFDGTTQLGESLLELLERREIEVLDICGLNGEANLYNTAIDALEFGFPTTVFIDLSSGSSHAKVLEAFEDLQSRGTNLTYAISEN